MKKLVFLLLAHTFFAGAFAQHIKLTQKQSDSDVKVLTEPYILYFKSSDMVSAIAEIDKVTKEDHSRIAAALKEGKIKSIDFMSPAEDVWDYNDLIRSNLGSYLLLRGKVAITKGKTPLTAITADESPEEVDLDGTRRVNILFMDGEEPVILGKLNTKLKPAK
jgi:hypothetical protein